MSTIKKRAYRFPSGDVAGSDNAKVLCFSEVNGTKCFVDYDGSDGAWDDSSSTLSLGADVYSDSATTTKISEISGGSAALVVPVLTLTITPTGSSYSASFSIQYEPGMTWAEWIDSDYNEELPLSLSSLEIYTEEGKEFVGIDNGGTSWDYITTHNADQTDYRVSKNDIIDENTSYYFAYELE